MDKMYFKDEIVVRPSAGFTDKLKKERVLFSDSETKKYLEVTVDATHCGYFNHNLFFYSHDGMAKAVTSWVHPYNKPVLTHHADENNAIGRVTQAAFIPIFQIHKSNDAGKEEKDVNILRGTPSGKIRLKLLVTDKKAVDDILDQRFFTVSTGGAPYKFPTCSICNKNVVYTPVGPSLDCDHEIGHVYDGKLCGMIIPEMEYKEVSFINCPADYSNEHVASVVSMQFVDDTVTNDITLGTLGSKSDTDDNALRLEDNIKNEEGVNMDVKTKPVSDEDFEKLITDALTQLGDCKTCEDGVDAIWENEDETKEAEEMAKDYESFVSLSIGYGPEEVEYDVKTEDAKLPPVGSKGRAKMKTSFCGPNRTFPIPDCKHAAVALAMVKWPKVVAKYSAAVRAKIVACVNAKAKTMNCPMAKKSDSSEVDVVKIQKDFDVAVDKIKTLEEQIASFDKNKKENDIVIKGSKDELEQANTKIDSLTKEIRMHQAEKVLDLSIMLNRPNVADIVRADSVEIRDTKYAEKIKELSDRTAQSLIDSISDLKKDMNLSNVSESISNPVIDDFERITKDKEAEKKNRKSWIVTKIFGDSEE